MADAHLDSILDSIKKLLGIDYDDDSFDVDIIIHINTVLQNLTQMGVGVKGGLVISDNSTTWDEFTEGKINVEQVKPYVYMKVRLIFDPPTSSSATTSINDYLKELEYRLYTEKNFIDKEE